MGDAIFVVNAGSTSMKFAIYEVAAEDVTLVSRGQIERLGASPHFVAKGRKGNVLVEQELKPTPHGAAYGHAFAHLVQWARQEFGATLSPVAVGHRVVHGGLDFIEPTLLTDEVIERLDRLVPLVPLHQPHNLAAIRAVSALRPDLPQVACFDTAFHRGRARVTERFGLSDELFERGIRRWGFHGLSYASIVDQLQQIAPEIVENRLIVAHLGSGASICAIEGGKSVDTTMSFSVLDGLPMGTRCGSLDAGVILFLLQSMGREELEKQLYKQSGLLGISGISGDVRELLASPSPRAAEAIEFFVYRVVREIGSLTTALRGLDALIFTAGVGENSAVIRSRICQGLAWLGLSLDSAANDRGRGCISPVGQSPSVWVIPTDEERVIGSATLELIHASAPARKFAVPVAGVN